MTIYEFMRFSNEEGFDICDQTFDWGNYFGLDFELKEKDIYEMVMEYFARNIEMVNYQKEWFSVCKVSEFIQAHRKAFDMFMKECNGESHQPNSSVSMEDEEFYWLYLATFESLINGNYSDDDYKLLLSLMLNN